MPLSDKEFERIKKLWAEAYLMLGETHKRLTEMGQIIGGYTKTFQEKLATGETQVTAVIRRADGSIRRTQEYKFKGKKDKQGKPLMVLKNKAIKDFPKE